MSTIASRVWFITGCSTGFGRELAKGPLPTRSASLRIRHEDPQGAPERVRTMARRESQRGFLRGLKAEFSRVNTNTYHRMYQSSLGLLVAYGHFLFGLSCDECSM